MAGGMMEACMFSREELMRRVDMACAHFSQNHAHMTCAFCGMLPEPLTLTMVFFKHAEDSRLGAIEWATEGWMWIRADGEKERPVCPDCIKRKNLGPERMVV